MNRTLTLAFMAASISVVVSMTTVFFMTQTSPLIVTFNVKQTLERYQQALIKKNINVEEQTLRLAEFADVMHQEVNAYRLDHNAIVLVDAAVVAGTIDVTPHIQQAILHRYQKE
ncbi:type-F conjugative transfer system protein TrbI [Vibrio mediterranei]|uniref:type-F conjugative transfer system protein TrbI n=1 Tax=Vibrio TaxID=662 RepID=UPI004068C6E1